jgi:uncharacterized damage-inducible protein DinB
MGAEELWLSRINGVSPKGLPAPEAYPTREAIRTHWDKVEAHIRAFLDSVDDAKRAQVVQYNDLSGNPRQAALVDILMHLANHGTDHRSQMLALLHQLGGRTLAQDAIYYTWEKPTL